MTRENPNSKEGRRKLRNLIPIGIIVVALIGIPFLILNYQANRLGLTRGEVIKRITGKSDEGSKESSSLGSNRTGEKIDFLDRRAIGQEFSEPPLIAHIQAVDLDEDGLLDVIVCDDKGNFVSWIRQDPEGVYTEKILADDIIATAHV